MPAKKQVSKEMIRTAALELLRTEGLEAVNIKALAAALHCSTQPIYLSYDGMDALRAELSGAAVEYFIHWLTQDSGGSPDLFGPEYIRFARQEKPLFRYLFLRKNAFSELKPALSPIIEASIARLMEAHQLDHTNADLLHDQLWMHAHGIACMIATEYCDWDMEKAQRLLAECRESLGRSYEGKS